MPIKAHRSAKHAGTATVSIHVRDLARLFNSLDPSPFWDRDLDRDAAKFIEEEFREKRRSDTWHLHVYTQDSQATATDLQVAIEHYYARLASSARFALREEIRIGQLALVVGATVFLTCMALRAILVARARELSWALDEGLIVIGWIALWRPVELLGYGWVPLLRQRRLYDRLSQIQVTVRPTAAAGPAGTGAIAHPT